MNSQQKLNIVFSIIIIVLITTVLYISLSENKAVNEQSDLDNRKKPQLMEIHHQRGISINGVVTASNIEEVQMKVSGRIDKDNRSLAVGSKIKRNEVLIKVERLEALYEMLSARSEFKELIQKLILSINDKFPSESNKWKLYENQIQRTLPIPTLPVLKTKDEEKLLNRLNVYSQYYKTKKSERKTEDYIYLAPFDGIIMESNISPGSSVTEEKTVLKLAKNYSYQVKSHFPLKDLDRIKKSDTVYFKSFEGDTLSKGAFLKTGSTLSDSSTIEVYYSILSQDHNLLNKPIYISIAAKPTKIPTSTIKNDSIEIYSSEKFYKSPIKIISKNGDSSVVEGLPEYSFININP